MKILNLNYCNLWKYYNYCFLFWERQSVFSYCFSLWEDCMFISLIMLLFGGLQASIYYYFLNYDLFSFSYYFLVLVLDLSLFFRYFSYHVQLIIYKDIKDVPDFPTMLPRVRRPYRLKRYVLGLILRLVSFDLYLKNCAWKFRFLELAKVLESKNIAFEKKN